EQAGLAGVRVAGNRDRGDRVAAAPGLLGLAGRRHLGELAAQFGDLVVHPTPVGLDLGLTGSATTDPAAVGADPPAGLARQVAAPAAQPLLGVLQLGELDLRASLAALGVLGED